MKIVSYAADAMSDLRTHRNVAARIISKVERYAKTGAGDVTQLVGSETKRLRVGDFRVLFSETGEEILVQRVGPRGSVYT